jgi:hypothetical protein
MITNTDKLPTGSCKFKKIKFQILLQLHNITTDGALSNILEWGVAHVFDPVKVISNVIEAQTATLKNGMKTRQGGL